MARVVFINSDPDRYDNARPSVIETAHVVPQNPEPLWEIQSAEGHLWSAQLCFHRGCGVEAQLFRDGAFVIGIVFPTKTAAVAWAAGERADREKTCQRMNDDGQR